MVKDLFLLPLRLLKLIHQPDLLPFLLVNGLVQRFDIAAGVQSLRQFFPLHAQLLGDLRDSRISAPFLLEPFLAEICLISQFLKRTADLDHPVVP